MTVMEKTGDEWTADVNGCMWLGWLRQGQESQDPEGIQDLGSEDNEHVHAHHPLFTHAMYGEQQTITGFKGLRIKVVYTPGSMFAWVNASFTQAKDAMPSALAKEKAIQTILAPILEKMPKGGWTRSLDVFLTKAKEDNCSFKPMGQLAHKYSVTESGGPTSYCIYKCNFDTPGFLEFHRRIQVMLLWYIDGASFLNEEDDKWQIMLVFKEHKNADAQVNFTFVGYVTYYPFYHYPDGIRSRISQFYILPPYQGQGHGAHLYNAFVNECLENPDVRDMTVEDPNESFDLLRNRQDVACLLRLKLITHDECLTALMQDTKDSLHGIITCISTKAKIHKKHAKTLLDIFLIHAFQQKVEQGLEKFKSFTMDSVEEKLEAHMYQRITQQYEDELSGAQESQRQAAIEALYNALSEEYHTIGSAAMKYC